MLFLHSFSGSARVSCIVSLDIVWCLECSTSSHLKVNKSLRKCTRKISFPCMTLRSVLANLMLVSGTCISEDEQGFPDPTEKERECFEDLEYSYLPDQASEYRKSVTGKRKETDRCISKCVRPSKKQHRMCCWFCGKAGHKKVECFARENSINMAKKVNKTFTKPKRVEEVFLAKSGLPDEIKEETSEDGCNSGRSDLEVDQETSSLEPRHELSDVVVILFIRIIRRSFLGQILGSDQINDAWRRVNMRSQERLQIVIKLSYYDVSKAFMFSKLTVDACR
ncbi:hypothetical protein Bca4012_043647 [Brassica carinata]